MSKLKTVREQFSELTPSQRYSAFLRYRLQLKNELDIELSELPFTSLEDTKQSLSMQRADNTYSLLEFEPLPKETK